MLKTIKWFKLQIVCLGWIQKGPTHPKWLQYLWYLEDNRTVWSNIYHKWCIRHHYVLNNVELHTRGNCFCISLFTYIDKLDLSLLDVSHMHTI